jgi:putative aldouronate transport system substrate-binding protein
VVFNANAPQEQIVAGMQFFNWLTSNQDNADLWLMGIEGVNYKKEPNLRFSDIAGVDPSRNYRRQWYVSGIGGVFQRQPLDLPKESEEALRFFTTKENWLFTPLEKFDVSTKEIETELAAMQAASGEAGFGLALGSLPTEEAMANYAQMLDAAGRQKVKEWFQAKIDAWVAENKDYIDSFETGL